MTGVDPSEDVGDSKQVWIKLTQDLNEKIDKDALSLKIHLDPLEKVEGV